jgi:ribosome-binding ATPase
LDLSLFPATDKKKNRVWTVKQATRTLQVAGVIHPDFEKHFIRTDFPPHHKDLVAARYWSAAREEGML